MAARTAEETDIFEEIASQINRSFNRLISRVKTRRDKLLAELHKLKLSFDKRSRAQDENLSELQDMRQQIEQMAIKQNFAITVQKSSLDEINLKIESLKNSSSQQPDLKFSCNLTDLTNQLSMLGLLEERTAGGAADDKLITPANTLSAVTVIGKKGREKGAFNCPQRLHIDTSTNLLYIADYYNNRVQIFSTEDWSYVFEFGTEKLLYPNSVATSKEYCYVTSYSSNGILQFSQSGLYLIKTVFKTGGTYKKLDGPSHIAVSPDSEVFVADWNNNRVCVFDTELVYLREIGAGLLKVPKHIVFKDSLTYVLDDSELSCLHVFSKEGVVVRSFLPKGEGKSVENPTSFCFDQKGDLVLADYGSDSLKLLSGNKVGSIGQKPPGAASSIGYFCVALCGDRLVVSCRELNCVKIL